MLRDSVLEAIRNGQWDFEPEGVNPEEFDSTNSLPGTEDKIKILADRAKDGLPLWHPSDRRSFDDSEQALV